MRAVNVASVRYLYKIDLWAAMHGYELPDRPKELTPEYLEGQASGSKNAPELTELAQLFTQFTHKEGGKP